MEISVEAVPRLRVGDWLLAIIIAFIVSMFLGILAATLLHQWVGDLLTVASIA
jgi:ABC-type dipeptide/oligopeptide/nickel transport system permease component